MSANQETEYVSVDAPTVEEAAEGLALLTEIAVNLHPARAYLSQQRRDEMEWVTEYAIQYEDTSQVRMDGPRLVTQVMPGGREQAEWAASLSHGPGRYLPATAVQREVTLWRTIETREGQLRNEDES